MSTARMPSLGDAISGLLKEYNLEGAIRAHRAISLWEEVTGPAIAKNSKALDVKGHILYIGVKKAAWRSEIAFHKDIIIEKLNALIGSKTIKEIRFR